MCYTIWRREEEIAKSGEKTRVLNPSITDAEICCGLPRADFSRFDRGRSFRHCNNVTISKTWGHIVFRFETFVRFHSSYACCSSFFSFLQSVSKDRMFFLSFQRFLKHLVFFSRGLRDVICACNSFQSMSSSSFIERRSCGKQIYFKQ